MKYEDKLDFSFYSLPSFIGEKPDQQLKGLIFHGIKGVFCVCVGGVRLPCLYFRGLSYENTPIHRGLYTFRGPKNGSSENVG